MPDPRREHDASRTDDDEPREARSDDEELNEEADEAGGRHDQTEGLDASQQSDS